MSAAVAWDLRSTDFAAALLDPDIDIPTGAGRDGEEKPKRFAVYRNNVVVSLIESVKAGFPAVHCLLGDENFTLVARNYIAQSPPSSPMMQNYGETFPHFLSAFPPLAESRFLADVAQLERNWLESYHAIDAEVLKPEDLAGLEPEQTLELRFAVHPAAKLLRSPYPVYDLFAAREEFPDMDAIDFDAGQSVLTTRGYLQVAVTHLDVATATFIESLMNKQSLAEAIGAAMEIDENFAPGTAIATMLETGIFSKIDTDGSAEPITEE